MILLTGYQLLKRVPGFSEVRVDIQNWNVELINFEL